MKAEDFLAKVDWEGGIDAALDYGLSASDIEDDDDSELREAWETLERLRDQGDEARRLIEQRLEDYLWLPSSSDEDEEI